MANTKSNKPHPEQKLSPIHRAGITFFLFLIATSVGGVILQTINPPKTQFDVTLEEAHRKTYENNCRFDQQLMAKHNNNMEACIESQIK